MVVEKRVSQVMWFVWVLGNLAVPARGVSRMVIPHGSSSRVSKQASLYPVGL